VPDPGVDLWCELESAVSRTLVRGEDARIIVADSKVVFDRTPRGEARLETCALAFLALASSSRRAPSSGRELLSRTPAALRGEGRLFAEPWIPFLTERLPSFTGTEPLARAAGLLESAARSREIEVVAAGTRVVPVAELNASLERTGNKARTHWDLTAGILRLLWGEHAREGLDLLVDRHGGRMRYEPLLRETFPGAVVVRVLEEKARSAYRVVERDPGGDRRMRIVFAERAESESLPVALASCLAKHARETCMRAFNAISAPAAGPALDRRLRHRRAPVAGGGATRARGLRPLELRARARALNAPSALSRKPRRCYCVRPRAPADKSPPPAPTGAALKIAILGAGVSGLSLARFLVEGGLDPTSIHLFESAAEVGGLCRSKTVDGFTFDVAGGHILYSKDAAAMQWMKDCAGGDEAFVRRDRHTRIRFEDRWVNYPFENGLGDLPPRANFDCLSGYVDAWHRRQVDGSSAPTSSGPGCAGASAPGSRITSWIPTTPRSGSATSST
jgi:hypothetical protein